MDTISVVANFLSMTDFHFILEFVAPCMKKHKKNSLYKHVPLNASLEWIQANNSNHMVR